MQLEQGPTLNTILMVEEALKNAPHNDVTVAELKKLLPRQVNHNTLKMILDYLDKSNKVYIGVRGITWIHNENPRLRKAVMEGIELK